MKTWQIATILASLMVGSFAAGCSASQEQPRTKFEVCMDSVNSSGSWSLFGDINDIKADSAALKVCADVLGTEDRERWIDKYTQSDCKGQKCATLTDREKRILEFLEMGVPKGFR